MRHLLYEAAPNGPYEVILAALNVIQTIALAFLAADASSRRNRNRES